MRLQRGLAIVSAVNLGTFACMLSQPVALRMLPFFNRSVTVLSSIGINANYGTVAHIMGCAVGLLVSLLVLTHTAPGVHPTVIQWLF